MLYLNINKLKKVFTMRSIILLVVMSSITQAQLANLTEYEIKAGFIYNFASFVQWPKEVEDPLNLCVYGKNPFAGNLKKLQGKKVEHRQINIIGSIDKNNIGNCHIIYFSQASKPELPSLLKLLEGKPVLTIADVNSAAHAGVMLNIVLRNKKLAFEANQQSARAHNLQISSRLLSLAIEVI